MTILDLRFAEIPYELLMLGAYVDLIENQLPALVEAEKNRIVREHDADDEGEREVASHLEWRLDEGVTSRFLTAAALMATWAVYETSIETIAGYVGHASECSLSMNDLKGQFLARARKYFDDVLKFDLHPVGTDWERLNRISILRNAFAHGNGRLPDIRPRRRRSIEAWARNDDGIEVVDDYVVLSAAYVSQARNFVDSLLNDLVERTKSAYA